VSAGSVLAGEGIGMEDGNGESVYSTAPGSSNHSGTRKEDSIAKVPHGSKENDQPLDLAPIPFSPHWSIGTYWSPSPSPRNISASASPALWPSPVTEFGKRKGGSPSSTEANEAFSPVRIEFALRQAMEKGLASPAKGRGKSKGKGKGKGESKVVMGFSTKLPKELRNISGVMLDGGDLESFSSEDDSLEVVVPKLDLMKSMTDIWKQALIEQFRGVIVELEATLGQREEERCSREQDAISPTPPPRPSAIPRNRIAGGRLRDTSRPLKPMLVLPSPDLSPPPKGQTSPAADGLYGAENVDQDYWTGFDQTYDVPHKSFDNLPGEGSPQQMWKSKGKWIEKGVSVLGQLNEESFESGSSIKGSPSSKKEVRWRDEVRFFGPLSVSTNLSYACVCGLG